MTRLSNGVRARSDGGGDTWAGEHRRALPNQCWMQDVDAVVGGMVFGTNGVDRLFTEYVPDSYKHSNDLIRRFGYVALFDRKQTVHACEDGVSTACYLDMARKLSLGQPIPVRFFFVVGKDAPWTMIEIDVTTGERIGTTELAGSDWVGAWERLGLLEARKSLSAWLETGEVEKVAEPVVVAEVTDGAVAEQEPAEVVEEEEAVEEEMPWRPWWDLDEEYEDENQGLTM